MTSPLTLVDAATFREQADPLPVGVHLVPLEAKPDSRGTLTEVFRTSWVPDLAPVQWNLVDNEARVMRGVHVHVRHRDYLMVVRGRATIGLRDLRRNSPTAEMVSLVELADAPRAALVIPPGVAHGFYFPVAGTHLYAVDEYWNTDDELGCLWNDPALEIPWPREDVRVSPRDADAISLMALLEQLEPHQASFMDV